MADWLHGLVALLCSAVLLTAVPWVLYSLVAIAQVKRHRRRRDRIPPSYLNSMEIPINHDTLLKQRPYHTGHPDMGEQVPFEKGDRISAYSISNEQYSGHYEVAVIAALPWGNRTGYLWHGHTAWVPRNAEEINPMALTISKRGVELIKEFEGCRLEAYRCPAGIWTIGYGSTLGVKEDDHISPEEAERLLWDDLETYIGAVRRLVRRNVTQNQFNALVSFAFNLGPGALASSTLLRLLNANTEAVRVANEFLRWDKVGSVSVDGLTRRRIAERVLFLS